METECFFKSYNIKLNVVIARSSIETGIFDDTLHNCVLSNPTYNLRLLALPIHVTILFTFDIDLRLADFLLYQKGIYIRESLLITHKYKKLLYSSKYGYILADASLNCRGS